MFSKVLTVALAIGLVNSLTYTVDTENEALFTINDRFVSAALDTGLLDSVNLSNPRLVQLAKHLTDTAPMYLRIGGTPADTVYFQDDTVEGSGPGPVGDSLVIKGSFFEELVEFTRKANLRLLFDLNSLLRNSDGSWDSSNAEVLIAFAQKLNVSLDWELGNEPDLYQAIYKKYVTAQQLGADYKNLREILNKYDLYKNSPLVGPSMFDVGSNKGTEDYLTNFLNVATEAVQAVTWHQYYFNGQVATVDLFLNPSTFNYLEQRTKVVTSIVGNRNKVWLGETSSCYNRGAPNLSDRFLASFLWLDKLGLGAQLGLDLIVRQTIWGYYYPLISEDYNPNPDWWVSLLYKKLVGPKVVSVTHDGDELRNVRLYAHCARDSDLWGQSAVVVFGVNIADSEQDFSLNLSSDDKVYEYELTADELLSQSVKLNGETLNLNDDGELPEINAATSTVTEKYSMPAHSIKFWVFPNSNVQACQ
ncbi:heparanase-like [Anthonomus grandis grandis]|uniref:heparanase-like n=1 Tax=Anthonomus grandis grandis TaxID=2921223 RepID=UPI0021664813|nr:heparanase-like [Anthonomus grandis grandis]